MTTGAAAVEAEAREVGAQVAAAIQATTMVLAEATTSMVQVRAGRMTTMTTVKAGMPPRTVFSITTPVKICCIFILKLIEERIGKEGLPMRIIRCMAGTGTIIGRLPA